MTRQVIWTKRVLEAFIDEANLNERQAHIMKLLALGETIVKTADEVHLSVDQVNKDIATLKKIYDETQKYSEILPPRKRDSIELFYSDNNK